jgi:uncharacterized protein YdeI (YjbR/CyaY-like superfamily)
VRLNDAGISVPTAQRKPGGTRAAIPEPTDLTALLAQNESAKATRDAFRHSHRREYLEWLTEAKTTATRDKRLAQTIAQLIAGKHRHWKYQK